jgi:sirohydrochlorin cobaltochelatase
MVASVSDGEFQDAALVVIAHGSTRNADSAVPAWQQVDAFKNRRIFASVTEAFWKQEPFVGGILRGVFAKRVFLVPLFIADGWFTRQVIPQALGLRGPEAADFPAVQVRGDQVLHYCGAVGSHPGMTEVLLARASDVVKRHPFPRAPRPEETALLIVGHGTSYSRGSREAIERQVELIRARGIYGDVKALFLEESPRVPECFDVTELKNLVLVPFFISDGLHAREDIPIALGETEHDVRNRIAAGLPTWRNPTERKGRRIWCAPAVGTDPLLAEVILQRVRETAAVGMA